MDKKAFSILSDYIIELRKWTANDFDKMMSLVNGKWVKEFKYSGKTEDIEYAIRMGYLFEPLEVSHEFLINEVKKLVSIIDLKEVADAFVASLSTRRLELRSALGSYACAYNLPAHTNTVNIYNSTCQICGLNINKKSIENLNILSFERFNSGGFRHESPLYEYFDLLQFSLMEKSRPNNYDYAIFKNIIKTIEEMPESAKLIDLDRGLKNVFKSNSEERRNVIEILGFCGILQTEEHKGFLERYTSNNKRDRPPVNKTDWAYPVMWWRRKNKINYDNLERVFGKAEGWKED